MSLPINQIQAICRDITQDIERSYQGLSLYFVIHGKGKMRDAIALSEHEIVSHPAGNAARAIIRKHTKGERSSFLGLAIANESSLFGFKKRDHLLGLFNINKDHYDNEVEMRAQIYQLAWHAVDLYEIRQEPAYRNKFKSGPMVPKRSSLNLAKAHLQADVFAGVMSVLTKKDGNLDHNLVKLIAQKRGVMALNAIADYRAEDFPSVIAIESCEFIIKELMQNPPPPEDYVHVARQLSLDVGQAFDEENIKQWWNFSIPAQDMAWRGYTKQEILGAAINTSNDPFVRSVGYLIQEVTDIEPASAASLEHSYNAFIDPDTNLKLHKEMVDSIFEGAITEGLQTSSADALLLAATQQNENLTEGRILGWCANALQDAAKAFQKALSAGTAPDQAARMHFEGSKDDLTSWETLKELGKNIVDQKRQGFAVTMGHIAEICHNNPAFSPVLDSIKMTMNDPAYIQKLEAANDLNMKPEAPAPNAMAPKGPAPKGPAPKAPGLENAPQVPNFVPAGPAGPGGAPAAGNSRAAQIARHNHALAQKAAAEKAKQGEDTKSTS